MRRLCCLLVFSLLFAGAAGADPEGSGAGDPERKITVELRDAALRDAVRTVLQGSGLQFGIAPGVPDVTINLNVRDITPVGALRLLVKQAAVTAPGLTLTRTGGVYQVYMRPSEGAAAPAKLPGAPGSDRKLTLNLRDTPIRDALQLIFQGSGVQYSVAATVPNVPINLNVRDISISQAVGLVVRQAAAALPGIEAALESGAYAVRIRAGQEIVADERNVTIILRGTPLREAIGRLFTGSPFQYGIDPNVPDVPVSLNVLDVSREQVLSLLVKQAAVTAPGLSYRRDGNVFLVTREVPADRAPDRSPTGRAPAEALRWEKIPLQFVDVGPVTEAVGGVLVAACANPPGPGGVPGAPPLPELPPGALPGGSGVGAAAPMAGLVPRGIAAILGMRADNSLLVRGKDEDIQELKRAIRLLDIPPRQVQVRLSAGKLVAEGRALNSAELRLADSAGAEALNVVARGRINGDGTIELMVEGKLVMAEFGRPIGTRVRLTPGKAAPLLTVGHGTRQIRLWARVTLLPEGQ